MTPCPLKARGEGRQAHARQTQLGGPPPLTRQSLHWLKVAPSQAIKDTAKMAELGGAKGAGLMIRVLATERTSFALLATHKIGNQAGL
jgi:hypothetical protein